MRIRRTRYVIMRAGRTQIWAGLAKAFSFRGLDDVGRVSVKTYNSAQVAKSSYSGWEKDYEIVECEETLDIKDAR